MAAQPVGSHTKRESNHRWALVIAEKAKLSLDRGKKKTCVGGDGMKVWLSMMEGALSWVVCDRGLLCMAMRHTHTYFGNGLGATNCLQARCIEQGGAHDPVRPGV